MAKSDKTNEKTNVMRLLDQAGLGVLGVDLEILAHRYILI